MSGFHRSSVCRKETAIFFICWLVPTFLWENFHKDTCPQFTSDPLRPLLFVRVCPSRSLHHAPVPTTLAVKIRDGGGERNRGNKLHHHCFTVSFHLFCHCNGTVAEPQKSPRTLTLSPR